MTTLIDNRPATMDVASLVEPDRVHRSVYTDPRVFDLEMERIWHRTWIYVGHESQVKEPGQYYATSIGKQPVLLTRHADGNFYVLYNRCAHKGALLVGDRCGKLKELRCCYHGWRFDFDGKLLGIPLEQGYDDTRFNRDGEEANMSRAARAESYRGFVFASLSPDAPDLKTWLGGVASSIDNMVDRAPDGAMQLLVRGEVAALPLKGIIDLDAEKARLDKEMAKAEADIKRVDAKLANAKFVANAPEEVVEEEREKRVEALARKAKILEALERLRRAA